MLERYAVKAARTVLRGGSDSNATPLPDHVDGWFLTANMAFSWLWALSVSGANLVLPVAGNASHPTTLRSCWKNDGAEV